MTIAKLENFAFSHVSHHAIVVSKAMVAILGGEIARRLVTKPRLD
jgi:hypothetical protein